MKYRVIDKLDWKLNPDGTETMVDHTKYDSTEETHKHILNVRNRLRDVMVNLDDRAAKHDASKLQDPEKSGWDEATPRLADLTYGTEEYRAELRRIRPIIEHHYANNDHHPEFYLTGVDGMSLMAVIEMLCDWKAASQRTKQTLEFRDSMLYNKDRFHISDQLFNILDKTCIELGFYDD